MMIRYAACRLLILAASLSGAARAQDVTPPQPLPVAGEHPVTPPDEGRSVADDREGLSSRGGADPTDSDKTFAETIGTPIYTAIGTPISEQLGTHH